MHSCEFELFHPTQNPPLVCSPRIMSLNFTMYFQIASPNSWIYVAPYPEQVQIVCEKITEHVVIHEIGILTIKAGCEVHAPQVVLTTQISFNSFINISRSSNLFRFDLKDIDHFLENQLLLSSQPPVHVVESRNQISNLIGLIVSRN